MIAAHLVRMRCPELALHFPDQVGELRTGRNLVEQRLVLLVDRVPVDARHVGDPELVALQSPHFAEHLAPFASRRHRKPHAIEIDPSALPRRRVGFERAFVIGLFRRQGAQPLAVANDQRHVIIGEEKLIDPLEYRLRLHHLEVEELEFSVRLLVTAASMGAQDRLHRPHHLVVARAGNLSVTLFANRERGDATLDTVEIDAQCARRFRLVVDRVLDALAFAAHSTWCRIERRRRVIAQRDQIGARGAWKRQLELHRVVNGVERAHRQKIQIAAVGIERRRIVAEAGLGHQRRLRGRHTIQLDRAMAGARPERVREPFAIGRPRELFGASGIAVIDDRHLSRIEIADDDFVAMIGDRDAIRFRRGAHLQHAADIPLHGSIASRVGTEHLHTLIASRVADHNSGRAIVQPLTVPVADTIGRAMLMHGAFPQREAEELAARFDREAVSVGMNVEAGEMILDLRKLSRRLRSVRGYVDRNARCRVGRGVEQPDFSTALVDDSLAVSRCVAGVEPVVIGVAPLVGAVVFARIEIADAFGIRQKPHPPTDQHRARNVAGELGHPAENSAAFGIDPQVTRGAAAIPLPARGIGRVASDHANVVGAKRKMIHLAERQHRWQSTAGRQRERAVIAEERLAVRGHEHDVALRCPAADHHVGTEPRHSSRRSAL